MVIPTDSKKIPPLRIASIDIGTNTILLLVAEVEKGTFRPLFEKETIVRLGDGLQKTGVISPEAMERGLQTLNHYLGHCQALGAQKVFAVGTSALREAKNAQDFLKLVNDRIGLPIQIISGEEEARLSFLAVVRDLKDPNQSILVVDVGGGSTEFIAGKGDRVEQWASLTLGSVRFMEQFLRSDPVQEKEWEEMEKEIRKSLSQIPRPRGPFSRVAVGGTATTLASVEQGLNEFDFKKIHHFVLKQEALENQLRLYRSKTIEERRKIPGLPPSRADVILAGAAILYLAMKELHSPSILISCHGIRYGLLYEKLNFPISNCGLGIAD